MPNLVRKRSRATATSMESNASKLDPDEFLAVELAPGISATSMQLKNFQNGLAFVGTSALSPVVTECFALGVHNVAVNLLTVGSLADGAMNRARAVLNRDIALWRHYNMDRMH